MSWEDQVRDNLVNYAGCIGCSEHAAIVSFDGTPWGNFSGFALKTYPCSIGTDSGATENITVNELANLHNAFENNGNCSAKGGIRMNGQKYFLAGAFDDKGIMYLKRNGGGATVGKTNLGYVIATWNASLNYTDAKGHKTPQNVGQCNLMMEKFHTYLVENGI